jgi:hypothetical protein
MADLLETIYWLRGMRTVENPAVVELADNA